MNIAMTPRRRRLAAGGLLLAVVWVALELTVMPLLAAYRGFDREREQITDSVVRYSRMEAGGEQLRRLLARSEAAPNVTGYLRAATAPLASAELQSTVKRLVEARQGQLVSVQSLPETEEAGLPRVAVRVHLRCTLECLQQLFYALETGVPRLFLDQVMLSAPMQRRGAPGRADRLDADFQLTGYLRG